MIVCLEWGGEGEGGGGGWLGYGVEIHIILKNDLISWYTMICDIIFEQLSDKHKWSSISIIAIQSC